MGKKLGSWNGLKLFTIIIIHYLFPTMKTVSDVDQFSRSEQILCSLRFHSTANMFQKQAGQATDFVPHSKGKYTIT